VAVAAGATGCSPERRAGEVARGEFLHSAQHAAGDSGICSLQVRVEVAAQKGTYFIDGRITCQFTDGLASGATCSYDIDVGHDIPGDGHEGLGKGTGGFVSCNAPRFPPARGRCNHEECRGTWNVDATFDINLPQGWTWSPKGEACQATGPTQSELRCQYFYRDVQIN
jgi:hypothetical protein